MSDRSSRDAVLTAYAQSLIKFKARKLARQPGFSRSDEEDLAQELTVALLAKAHLFDPSRASVNTFAARVIDFKIAMIFRDRSRFKRAAGLRAQSLEQPSSGDADTDPLRDSLAGSGSSGPETVEQSDFVAVVGNAVRSLPPNLQEIATRLKVDPASAVARDLGISRRQVRNAIELIRQHFERKGLNDL